MEIQDRHGLCAGDLLPGNRRLSAARIEEEVVVTDTGCEVISLFPAEELPIANRY